MIFSNLPLFRVRGDDPTLAIAQKAALSKQVPLMYFILLVNTWGVAITHLNAAPAFLTIGVPSLMTLVCVLRVLRWWQGIGQTDTDPIRIIADLRRTNRLAWILAAVFATWGIALAPYGDNFMQSHVAFYMGITVIGCIFCLTHLVSAAMAVTLVVNVVFIAYFGLTGNYIFIAMAIDVGLVSMAMLMVLWVQYRDFTNLVVSREELKTKKNVLEKRELDLIEEQKQTQALSDENRKLANLDSLTGLANRRFFFAKLDEAICQPKEQLSPTHVGIIDLDGFKLVNDVYGHRFGDELLVQLASRLSFACRGEALIARVGGDEFAFLTQIEAQAAKKLAEKICNCCREPFSISNTIIQIGGSIGMARSDLCIDAESYLYEQADFALYQAEREVPGSVVIFSQAHYESLSRMTVIEQALRDGSIDNDITVYFQPIFDIHLNMVVAFEALARWTHPTLGIVSPAEFIPAAERLGSINHLSRLLLTMALREARTWPSNIRLSFNLSARDLTSSDNAMRLLAIIGSSGIEPHRLDLEITETALMTDLARAQATAQAFIAIGVGVSLDDFGTGYSSLTHLHLMPLTKIKIDRSFVTGIDGDLASAKIVKSLIRMAHDMDLECIVEGVENDTELATIHDLGGRFVQGYQISKPLNATDARKLAQFSAKHVQVPLSGSPV
ncbi:putative bifunctional diguanylate cyclase/phosphodiesterase [Rhizobium wenxiniae]|nr:EAL domain-containing protein [Rhizobium wenxiniae]